jgi:hypothetical protein
MKTQPSSPRSRTRTIAAGLRATVVFSLLLVLAVVPVARAGSSFGAVTELEMYPVVYDTSAGQCTTTVTFTCAVTVDGPALVKYQWEFSDGGSYPPSFIEFEDAGTEILTTSWTLYMPYSGWVRLNILAPNVVSSKRAKFTTTCQQGSPTSPDPGPKRGRFLVTVNGFVVDHETSDDIFERDGARDEVSLVPHVYVTNAAGGIDRAVWSDVFSSILGQRRSPSSGAVMAGGATPTGGLRTGDTHPTTTPWIRSGGPTAGLGMPARMFEGELVSGGNAAVVFPTLWEWDAPTHALVAYQDAMFAARPAVAGAVAPMITSGAPLSLDAWRLPGSVLGLGAMTSLGDGPLGLGERGFRPIGMTRSGDRWVYTPTALVLTYDSAEFISRADFGFGRGVVEFKYQDDPALQGSYRLFVQVERLP